MSPHCRLSPVSVSLNGKVLVSGPESGKTTKMAGVLIVSREAFCGNPVDGLGYSWKTASFRLKSKYFAPVPAGTQDSRFIRRLTDSKRRINSLAAGVGPRG